MKGFIMSLEPALSLLMLLLLITVAASQFMPEARDYSEVTEKVHETDLWLVRDSLSYYNVSTAAADYAWAENEIKN